MFQKAGKICFIITTLIVLIFGTAQWMRGKNAFSLKNVQISGTRHLNGNKLLQQVNIEFNRDIFDIEVDRIEDRLKKNKMIKNVNVVRRIPSTLKIEVNERELVAILFTDSEMYGVDEDGYLISNIDSYTGYDLPVLSVISSKAKVKAIEQGRGDHIQVAAQFLKTVKKENPLLYHRISEISYHSTSGLFLYLRDMIVPVILGFGNYRYKSKYFALVYPQIEKDFVWNDVAYVDLRFDSQVIVKKK